MTVFTLDLPVPRRALALAAHPDDVEFGCGGTLAKWAAAGCAIHHVICTDGSKGSWDPAADLGQLVQTRQEEQREAARILGGTGDVIFFTMAHYPAQERMDSLQMGTVGGERVTGFRE